MRKTLPHRCRDRGRPAQYLPGVARATTRVRTVPAEAARRLLLEGCALAHPPLPATRARVISLVRALGFVQVDSISSVERAHHLAMHARLEGYAPAALAFHSEQARTVFEHWTHDASLVRADWLPWWTRRFDATRRRFLAGDWMRRRLGRNWRKSTSELVKMLEDRGPMSLREVHDHLDARHPRSSGWWDWSPHKAALEFLWRTGSVAIHSRRGFEKVYDLASRVHGRLPAPPSPSAHREWACVEALARLGAATPQEIAGFMGAVSTSEARAWCDAAARDGRIDRVRLERLGRGPRAGFARRNWEATAGRGRPDRTPRLLSPFDPLIRDRGRALELFGLDYRFEAFVPAARRRYGYYTMPVLVGDQFACRLDLASDRPSGTLRVDRAWAEPGTPRRDAANFGKAAADRLAGQLGLRLQWKPRSIELAHGGHAL
jgi:uncharacterized protein YcaQ